MIRRVPILGEYDMLEPGDQVIDLGQDLIAAADRQRAARAEIILHIDDDKDRVFGGHACHLLLHMVLIAHASFQM
jgi:hypothetical protein